MRIMSKGRSLDAWDTIEGIGCFEIRGDELRLKLDTLGGQFVIELSKPEFNQLKYNLERGIETVIPNAK